MNVMSQWQDSQTNMISCSYIHHPLQYTSLRVLSKSYQNSILEQSSSMLSESHSVWRWKSMPLTTENTNFFTCYIMVALLTPPPKMLLLPSSRPKLLWSLQNVILLISRLALITKLPTYSKYVHAREHSHFWGLNSHLDHKHHLVYARVADIQVKRQ